MRPNIQEYIEEFNRGELERLLPIFGNIENILKFFQKQKVLYTIDPINLELEDYQIEMLHYLLNNLDNKSTIKDIVYQLSDVEIKDGEYYLKLTNKSDLSVLFKSYGGRDTSPRDIVNSLFEDDMWEPYTNTTDNVYRDVIEELNSENIQILKKRILELSTNWRFDVDDNAPDFFHNEVGVDGNFYVTSSNVGDIIGSEELMDYLMDNDYLGNLENDLYSIHNNAYNQAYYTEINNDVMNELSTFFDVTTSKWVTESNSNNREFYVIKFNPNEFVNSIKKYVSNKDNWGHYSYNIDYMGSWLTLMEVLMDSGDEEWLNFRIPDYADWNLTRQYINELFPDYI
jgi:hypothetical protein